MPIKAKPACSKGHVRPPGSDCPECSRQRALARYNAKRDEINVARNEKRRGKYKPRPKSHDADGNLICANGHIRAPGSPCQICRVATLRESLGGKCRKGHPRDPGERQCSTCSREYKKMWHAAHRGSELAKSIARYYDLKAQGINPNDPDRNRKWKASNRDRVNELNREYAQRNPERIIAKNLRWRAENPERNRAICRAAANRRNARKKGALGSHTEAEWQAIIARQRGLCIACGHKKKLTKDHIVPISLGGCDYAWNIAGMCKPCNSRKRASLPKGTQLSLYDRVTEIVRRE